MHSVKQQAGSFFSLFTHKHCEQSLEEKKITLEGVFQNVHFQCPKIQFARIRKGQHTQKETLFSKIPICRTACVDLSSVF